jgi:hypothetical protein
MPKLADLSQTPVTQLGFGKFLPTNVENAE